MYHYTKIVHSSFNLYICNTPYPTPPPSLYQLKIWDCKKTDSTNIRKLLDSAHWAKLFDQKDINVQVSVLNKTILNIL